MDDNFAGLVPRKPVFALRKNLIKACSIRSRREVKLNNPLIKKYEARKICLPKQLSMLIASTIPIVTHFHEHGQLAPHAVTMDMQGKLVRAALVVEDGVPNCTVEYAVNHFERSFRKAALSKQIAASGVFYHGVGLSQPGRAAKTEDEARAIVGLVEHRSGTSVYYVVPYIFAAGRVHYESAKLLVKTANVFVEQAMKPERWWRFW